MADCYNCGASIAAGHGYRREVYTGHSRRFYYGRRFSASSGSSYGMRTICGECAQRMADGKSRNAIVGLVVILLIIGVGLQDKTKTSNPATSSADIVGVPSAASVKPHSARATAASKSPVSRATVRTPPSFVAHNEIWTLTSDTDVLTSESGAIARVHAGRTIHVIGISADGEYLQVVLHDRRRGFVVASAAQYKSDWEYDGSK
jgi:hypothetical protein